MKNIIPIKIDVIQKRESKITKNQMFFIFLFGGIALMGGIFGISKSVNAEEIPVKIFGISLTILIVLIVTRLLMKFGLNEKLLYERYTQEINNTTFTIKGMWDIISIEDTGKILFKNGKNAYLVKMDRTSIIGKPKGFEEENYSIMTNVIKQLMVRDCIVKKYKLVVSDANVEKFDWLESKLAQRTNQSLKHMANIIIKHNKEQTAGKNNRSIEYWLIYNRRFSKNDYIELKSIFNTCAKTIYKPVISDKKGVEEFLYRYYKLDAINFKSAMYSNLDRSLVAKVDDTTLVSVKLDSIDIFAPIANAGDVRDYRYEQMLKKLREEDNE